MSLSHFTDEGEVHMVDISGKERSHRRARAAGRVEFPPGVLSNILEGGSPKGDFLAVARVAGIQAAKKTPETIPLAHPFRLTHLKVKLDPIPEDDRIEIICEARADDATGVEMEALSGVSGAALTLYDMCKSEHKGIRVTEVSLLEKEGGTSGDWTADSGRSPDG